MAQCYSKAFSTWLNWIVGG